MCILCCSCLFFFFKQKTAYEMRISDWSSDVCSSDLGHDSGAMSITGISTLSIEASESITLDAPLTTSTGKHTVEGLLTYLAGLAGFNGETGSTSITGRSEERRGGKEGVRTCRSRG